MHLWWRSESRLGWNEDTLGSEFRCTALRGGEDLELFALEPPCANLGKPGERVQVLKMLYRVRTTFFDTV